MKRRGFIGLLAGLPALFAIERAQPSRRYVPSRTHEADEVGNILATGQDQWEHLRLPAMIQPLPFKPPSPELFHLLEEIKKLSA
jgi:hypothetical protein